MSDKTNHPASEDKRQADREDARAEAAARISARGARHFCDDPELARQFAAWEGDE